MLFAVAYGILFHWTRRYGAIQIWILVMSVFPCFIRTFNNLITRHETFFVFFFKTSRMYFILTLKLKGLVYVFVIYICLAFVGIRTTSLSTLRKLVFVDFRPYFCGICFYSKHNLFVANLGIAVLADMQTCVKIEDLLTL